jgi:hypothetical protein
LHVPGICQCFGGTPQSIQKVVNLYDTTACHVPKESSCDNHHQEKFTSHKTVLFDIPKLYSMYFVVSIFIFNNS